MASYGYTMFTFQIHLPGRKEEPLTLGELFQPLDSVEADALGWKNDALPVVAGVLRGADHRVEDNRQRHLTIKTVEGAGRSIRFTVELGTSGQSSDFIDPDSEGDEPVFQREDRHIETAPRRGLLVVPGLSKTGLLALESRGRSTGRDLIQKVIKRGVKRHTGLIVDFDAVVHEEALRRYMEQASVQAITLHRVGMPADIADDVQLGEQESDVGRMKLIISPGSARTFMRNLFDKFRTDSQARNRLLRMRGLDFQELSVRFDDGQRQSTMVVTADRVPSFTYHLSSRDMPSNEQFYSAVIDTVEAIASPMRVSVGPGWQTGAWSEEASQLRLPPPAREEVSVDESPVAGS